MITDGGGGFRGMQRITRLLLNRPRYQHASNRKSVISGCLHSAGKAGGAHLMLNYGWDTHVLYILWVGEIWLLAAENQSQLFPCLLKQKRGIKSKWWIKARLHVVSTGNRTNTVHALPKRNEANTLTDGRGVNGQPAWNRWVWNAEMKS